MSTEKSKQKSIEELENAKNKLSKLIENLKEDPSFLPNDILSKITGGFSSIMGDEEFDGSGNTNNFC